MSFGKAGGGGVKKFESQEEVDERRKKRQEDWERVRKPDDPEECPEEDGRSLYDRLQEQKDKQLQEYEDQFRLRNSVKGLEKEESEFLDLVSKQQMEIEKSRRKEEQELIKEMREASGTAKTPVAGAAAAKEGEKKASARAQPLPGSSMSSQQALLLGSIKRKSSSDSKAPDESPAKKLKSVSAEGKNTDDEDSSDIDDAEEQRPQTARVIGILPGIGAYSDDSTASDSSSSDSSGLDDLFTPAQLKKFNVQIHHAS